MRQQKQIICDDALIMYVVDLMLVQCNRLMSMRLNLKQTLRGMN